ncbi:hypothetical protein C1646_688049 [Rhizophagus diaphanus]|nr:hypothetical protein C1646_688049 [Rhizophagus diaphanus] [Rhizophagus sp. MUCL 43196]
MNIICFSKSFFYTFLCTISIMETLHLIIWYYSSIYLFTIFFILAYCICVVSAAYV